MTDNRIVGNITDSLKDQLDDKLNPGKVFTKQNLSKQRNAFWTCFIAAFLLVLLAVAGSLAYNASKVSLFQEALNTHVVTRGLLNQSDADAFAKDTIDYLTGIKSVWEPAVTVAGFRVGVPDSFKAHMAEVKGWVDSASAILLGGIAIVLLLLGRALFGNKSGKKGGFSVGGYYAGVAVPLVLLGGIGLWGYFDFESLWGWIHRVFIPNGIFDAEEAIMQLFPVTLFQSYVQPVAITFAIGTAVILLLPLLLWPVSRLLSAHNARSAAAQSKRRAASAKQRAGQTSKPRKTTRK